MKKYYVVNHENFYRMSERVEYFSVGFWTGNWHVIPSGHRDCFEPVFKGNDVLAAMEWLPSYRLRGFSVCL